MFGFTGVMKMMVIQLPDQRHKALYKLLPHQQQWGTLPSNASSYATQTYLTLPYQTQTLPHISHRISCLSLSFPPGACDNDLKDDGAGIADLHFLSSTQGQPKRVFPLVESHALGRSKVLVKARREWLAVLISVVCG